MTERRVSKFYTQNRILYSSLGGRFYFVKKAQMLDGGVLLVVGNKVDVTADVQRFIDEATRKAKTPKPRRARKGRKS